MMYTRTTCRLCESDALTLIYKMPATPPVDNFRLPGEPEISLPNFPMDLYMCDACGHAQLLTVVDPQILYGNYIYTSSSSTDLDNHFSAYADRVSAYLQLPRNAAILDVGSNDGLLLSKFAARGFRVLGIDPSAYVAAAAEARGIKTLVSFFDRAAVAKVLQAGGPFDLVTANNVFSHADNLREFATSVREVLADNGTFVFEVSYLKDLVEHVVIDYVYHEHLCQHSVKPLKQFMAACGLQLIYVERIPTKGGSIRAYAKKAGDPTSPEPVVESMIADEIDFGLYRKSTYDRLKARVDAIAAKLAVMLDETLARGGSVASYGASATTTVLNALLGITGKLSFIVDDNPLRQNRLGPGFFVPVRSSAALADFRPDVVVLSAWRFADQIVAKNQEYLSRGGCFIVPLPDIQVVKHEYSRTAI